MKIKAKNNLRKCRIIKGFTQVELAEKVELTPQMIGQLENGISGVNPSNAKKIVKVLNVEFDDVFELVERGE